MAPSVPRPFRMHDRMSPAEALMWTAERDPLLRSAFLNVTILDRPADPARFRERIALAVEAIPRLRQRVRPEPGVLAPVWVDDASFDLDFHVRRTALPKPGHDRQLFDLAALVSGDAFDPNRPLWQFTLVEGLSGGRGALLAKMHHTITDGVGGVRLSAMFTDLERDAAEPIRLPGTEREQRAGPRLGTVAGAVVGALDPRSAVSTARFLSRQLLVTQRARSPLWAGKRSLGRRCEALRVDLDAVRSTSKAWGGSVNDAFVCAVAHGAGEYHRARGEPVDELMATMPVNTRGDKSAGGNSFAPTRIVVPTGAMTMRERFDEVHRRLDDVKTQHRGVGLIEPVVGAASMLPAAVVTSVARNQVGTVDFATSNVRGAPFDLYIAGAEVLSNHPMGPTGGTAFNATVLSYRNSMDIGIVCDTAAIDDSGLLRDCIGAGFDELIARS